MTAVPAQDQGLMIMACIRHLEKKVAVSSTMVKPHPTGFQGTIREPTEEYGTARVYTNKNEVSKTSVGPDANQEKSSLRFPYQYRQAIPAPARRYEPPSQRIQPRLSADPARYTPSFTEGINNSHPLQRQYNPYGIKIP